MLLLVKIYKTEFVVVVLWNINLFILAVISGNFNRLEIDTRNQIETLNHKDKLVIVINKTDPEIMKQIVIFMYTGKCELNEGNGKLSTNKISQGNRFYFLFF